MKVLGLIVVGWLGFNVAMLAGAVVTAFVKRHDEVHPDVHEMLDAARNKAAH